MSSQNYAGAAHVVYGALDRSDSNMTATSMLATGLGPISSHPSVLPSETPSGPSPMPSASPSNPTFSPSTAKPSTHSPSDEPTAAPTDAPTPPPSARPSRGPTAIPSHRPTVMDPTRTPTTVLTHIPTHRPSTVVPTLSPTSDRFVRPSLSPSVAPTWFSTFLDMTKTLLVSESGDVNRTLTNEFRTQYIINATRSHIVFSERGNPQGDLFVVHPQNDSTVKIDQFNNETDRISFEYFPAILTSQDLAIARGSVVITLPGNQVITILNHQPSDIQDSCFVFSEVSASNAVEQQRVVLIYALSLAVGLLMLFVGSHYLQIWLKDVRYRIKYKVPPAAQFLIEFQQDSSFNMSVSSDASSLSSFSSSISSLQTESKESESSDSRSNSSRNSTKNSSLNDFQVESEYSGEVINDSQEQQLAAVDSESDSNSSKSTQISAETLGSGPRDSSQLQHNLSRVTANTMVHSIVHSAVRAAVHQRVHNETTNNRQRSRTHSNMGSRVHPTFATHSANRMQSISVDGGVEFSSFMRPRTNENTSPNQNQDAFSVRVVSHSTLSDILRLGEEEVEVIRAAVSEDSADNFEITSESSVASSDSSDGSVISHMMSSDRDMRTDRVSSSDIGVMSSNSSAAPSPVVSPLSSSSEEEAEEEWS
eukprot:gene25895-32402_t